MEYITSKLNTEQTTDCVSWYHRVFHCFTACWHFSYYRPKVIKQHGPYLIGNPEQAGFQRIRKCCICGVEGVHGSAGR